MSEHPAAYTVHSSPLRCPDEQWLADALLGHIIAPAHLAALTADAARLAESIRRIEACSTRLTAQRRMALREADALHAGLRRLGGGR